MYGRMWRITYTRFVSPRVYDDLHLTFLKPDIILLLNSSTIKFKVLILRNGFIMKQEYFSILLCKETGMML